MKLRRVGGKSQSKEIQRIKLMVLKTATLKGKGINGSNF